MDTTAVPFATLGATHNNGHRVIVAWPTAVVVVLAVGLCSKLNRDRAIFFKVVVVVVVVVSATSSG